MNNLLLHHSNLITINITSFLDWCLVTMSIMLYWLSLSVCRSISIVPALFESVGAGAPLDHMCRDHSGWQTRWEGMIIKTAFLNHWIVLIMWLFVWGVVLINMSAQAKNGDEMSPDGSKSAEIIFFPLIGQICFWPLWIWCCAILTSVQLLKKAFHMWAGSFSLFLPCFSFFSLRFFFFFLYHY